MTIQEVNQIPVVIQMTKTVQKHLNVIVGAYSVQEMVSGIIRKNAKLHPQ